MCTNSILPVHQFLRARAGFKDLEDMKLPFQWFKLIGSPIFKLIYMPRENLKVADELEKQGRYRSGMIRAWC